MHWKSVPTNFTFFPIFHFTEARETNGVIVAQNIIQSLFGGWPVLENNPGGFFDTSKFDLTQLAFDLLDSAGSSSIMNAQVRSSNNGVKLEVGRFDLTLISPGAVSNPQVFLFCFVLLF